jgi:hypothetical protein
MKNTYYFGTFNPNTKLFNKNVGREEWERKKAGHTLISCRTELRYYTQDRCFIKNKTLGTTTTEKFGTIQLKGPHELLVESTVNELPFFPTQYVYFNKQIHSIEDYKTADGQIISFSNYIENNTPFYEIYSSSSLSSSSL